MYAVYLRLIGKLVVDLNFVTIHAFVRQKTNRQTDTHMKNLPAFLQRCKNAAVCDGAISRFWRRYDVDIFALKIAVIRHDTHCMSEISILSLLLMISMSKSFAGDFNSLIFELTRLTLALVSLRRGTAGAQAFPAAARLRCVYSYGTTINCVGTRVSLLVSTSFALCRRKSGSLTSCFLTSTLPRDINNLWLNYVHFYLLFAVLSRV